MHRADRNQLRVQLRKRNCSLPQHTYRETLQAPQVPALSPKGTRELTTLLDSLCDLLLGTPHMLLSNSICRTVPATSELAEHSIPMLHMGPRHWSEGPAVAIQHLHTASPTAPRS